MKTGIEKGYLLNPRWTLFLSLGLFSSLIPPTFHRKPESEYVVIPHQTC
jgi:hypothetical protein